MGAPPSMAMVQFAAAIFAGQSSQSANFESDSLADRRVVAPEPRRDENARAGASHPLRVHRAAR